MGQINREDMLELTRRMTVSRNCFLRIAGAYFDEEGYVDGTFNTHFLKLSGAEQEKNLKLAKTIPFAQTNRKLKEYAFTKDAQKPGSIWQFLMGLLEAELKNDAMLDIFYETFGERYQKGKCYAVYFFLGNYDIPRKGTDQAEQWESEEVYRFVICAVCPVNRNYEPDEPECGFLFPAFKDRGGALDYIDVFCGEEHRELMDMLGME